MTAYDAVVIGAGHNGLVVAARLQRAGLRTLVIEADPAPGGMTATAEPVGAGFRHSPHASFLSFQRVAPMVRDLDLIEHGLRTVRPEVQHGVVFDDDRPPVLLHRADQPDATHASLARFSRRDADRYTELRARAGTLTASMARVLYEPMTATVLADHIAAVGTAYRDLGIADYLGTRSAIGLIEDLFESDEVRTLLLLLTVELGGALDEVGSDVAFLGSTMWIIGAREVPLGGMQTLADALVAAATGTGVDVRPGGAVTAITVEGGRVTGVFIGDEHVPARVIVSSVGIEDTLLRFLPEDALDDAERRAVTAFSRTTAPAIASQAFALHEPPRYRATRYDPDIDRCAQVFIGYQSSADVREHADDLARALLPRPRAAVRVPSLHDPSVAPARQHLAGADSQLPDLRTFTPAQVQELARTYDDALLQVWRSVAPNMTRDNVIADSFLLPRPGDRRILLRSGNQHSTSVAGLFLCGAGTYPGGGVHGGGAEQAFQAVVARGM